MRAVAVVVLFPCVRREDIVVLQPEGARLRSGYNSVDQYLRWLWFCSIQQNLQTSFVVIPTPVYNWVFGDSSVCACLYVRAWIHFPRSIIIRLHMMGCGLTHYRHQLTDNCRFKFQEKGHHPYHHYHYL